MPLILRVDIDKPFGLHSMIRRVASKLKEDYWFPDFLNFDYLGHHKEFLRYCNKNKVVGHMYHRYSTIPDKETKALTIEGGHHYGFHAENTRSLKTFQDELNLFIKLSEGLNVQSFSKHGSGQVKLGKYHYPKYEPENYKKWSKDVKILYPFGNDPAVTTEDLLVRDGNYFEHAFWLEHRYRSESLNKVEDVIEMAKKNDIVVLIHPCNYKADTQIRNDFHKLVELAEQNEIKWILLNNPN
jgi:hypothetical protein